MGVFMLKATQRIDTGRPSAYLTLPLDQRLKGRLRAQLEDGREIGLFLARGPIMRGGDLLQCVDGTVVQVKAAEEPVSVVIAEDAHLLARACYHLGNRHTPLQILNGELRYQHDHVLDQMLHKLGLQVNCARLPFEPEPGAYGEHGSDHSHGHSHAQGQIHAH